MTDFPPLRVGSVPYLNVQPLIAALEERPVEAALTFAPPRALAEKFRGGLLDVAIVPVFEYLQRPVYSVVPDVCIASRGAVASVLLLSDEPPEALSVIRLDGASLTSIHLLKVLLADRGQEVRYEEAPPGWQPLTGEARLPPRTGRLLIGDPALAAARRFRFVTDLGRWWSSRTGLPFVYAAWLVHPQAAARPMNHLFREARDAGMARLDELACARGPLFGMAPGKAVHYYRRHLHFTLGSRELAGWELFARWCARLRLIPSAPAIRFHEY